jgi:FkbM family methyltransferase
MTTGSSYLLPNGNEIVSLNDNETQYLYEEIFEQREYLPRVELRERPVIVDLGANIGMFSLFAINEWRPSRIIAVEPIAELRNVLSRNLSEFSEAQIAPVAAGRVRERSVFTYYPGFSIMSGRYCDATRDLETAKSIARQKARALPEDEQEVYEETLDFVLSPLFTAVPEQVDVWPLSQIIREYHLAGIDLLKVDVEGSEIEVLEGIDDRDWPSIRNIIIEVDAALVDLEKILGMLANHGMAYDLSQQDRYSETGLHIIYASYSL